MQTTVILNDNVYRLEHGVLIHSALLLDGRIEGEVEPAQWVEVECFDDPDTKAELDTALTMLIAADTEASLCDEYADYCAAHGMPQVSADEQDTEALPAEQRLYLTRFIARWERAVENANAPEGAVTLDHAAWINGSRFVAVI